MGISRLIIEKFLFSICVFNSGQLLAQDGIHQKSLPSIVIIDQKRNFIEKADTIIYNAKAFMHKEVHKVKDLLLNMPGFSVDPTGRVMFNGKEVKHVMINGEDLTGNKYEVITKNLQAGLISKVELVKRFHENRLLSGFEWGDELAINLVIDDNRKYKINTQVSLGISSLIKKKEMDANIISLYKKTSTLMFVDANNIGRKSNVNDSFSESELFRLPTSQSNNDVQSDISENYWRHNNDKQFNIYHAIKATQHVSLKTHVKDISQNLLQHQNMSARYYFPGTDSWKYTSNQYNDKNIYQKDLKLDAKYDNLKNHTSNYQLQMIQCKERYHTIQFAGLPVFDTTQTTHSEGSKDLLISGNDFIRVNKKYILESEVRFLYRQLGDHLNMISVKLQFLPDVFSGATKVFNDANAIEQNFQMGNRLLFKSKNRYEQVGWKMDNQYVVTTNTIHAMKLQDSSVRINKNAIFQNNRFQVYWKREYAFNKHLQWFNQSSMGISNVYWNKNRVSGIIGYLSTTLQFRKSSFKQIHLGLTISRGNPNKNAYFVSPMMNNQMQIMSGASAIYFPIKSTIYFMKTYNDLYKGLSCTYHVSFDQQMHSLHSTVNQHPFYSMSGYYIGKRNTNISSFSKIQKNIFSLKIKPFVEIQYNSIGQDQVLNDILYRIGSRSCILRTGYVSYWNTKMNVETNLELRFTSLNVQSVKNETNMMDKSGKADLKVKYDISKNFYASIYGLIWWNMQYGYSSTCMDAYLECKMSERTMLMFRLHNLFNAKLYRERINSPYVFQETSIDMIPRYLMFSVQVNL